MKIRGLALEHLTQKYTNIFQENLFWNIHFSVLQYLSLIERKHFGCWDKGYMENVVVKYFKFLESRACTVEIKKMKFEYRLHEQRVHRFISLCSVDVRHEIELTSNCWRSGSNKRAADNYPRDADRFINMKIRATEAVELRQLSNFLWYPRVLITYYLQIRFTRNEDGWFPENLGKMKEARNVDRLPNENEPGDRAG